MRISEYDKLETLPETANVLLDSENTGTRTMFANDFAKQSAKFLGTDDVLGQVNLDELTEKVGPSREACLFYQDGDSKYKVDLFDLPFASVDANDYNKTDINRIIPRKRIIIRNKNIGSTFTTEQINEISIGRFRDMFVGDYWEINNIRWRIVDIDYWYGTGPTVNNACLTHHLVIMPDCILFENPDSPSGTSNPSIVGGYYGSRIRTVVQGSIKNQIIQSIPENMILTRTGLCTNSVTEAGVPAGCIETQLSIEVPNAESIFGYDTLIAHTNFKDVSNYADGDSVQFSLFSNAPKNIITSHYGDDGTYGFQMANYWLRNMAAKVTSYVTYGNIPYHVFDTNTSGAAFRPVFGLRAPAAS